MAFRGTRLHIIAPWEVSDSTPVFSLLNPLQCLSTASIDAAFDFGLQCCASSACVVVFSPLVYSVVLVLCFQFSGSVLCFPSNNFLYCGHYSGDGHYHLGNRFLLQLLQNTFSDEYQCDIFQLVPKQNVWGFLPSPTTGLFDGAPASVGRCYQKRHVLDFPTLWCSVSNAKV